MLLGVIIFILANIINIRVVGSSPILSNLTRIAMGISGSMTIIGISAVGAKSGSLFSGLWKMIYSVGFFSMSIYLLHTFFSGTVFVINYQVLKTNQFLLPAILAIIAAIAFPLTLEKYFFGKVI